MNILILTGRVVKPPILNKTTNKISLCMITVAVQRKYKNKYTKTYDTDFFDIVLFGQLAEYAGNYWSIGELIELSCRLQKTTWKTINNNAINSKLEIIAESVKLLSHPKNNLLELTVEENNLIQDILQDI